MGFFQTVRAALAKSAPGPGKSSAQRDLAVQQIISRAVVSTDIVDILKAAGLETPDISILSDEFLAEVQGMKKKNLALEALRKLINGEIRSQSRVNVVQTRAFSDRLEEAIARYHNNAITTAEVLQELIELAKDIRAAHQRGEEEGLSQEEISFYDALAHNESAVEVMGNDHLRVIAHELLNSLKEQRFRGLAASRIGAGANAGFGQTHSPQARLSAGPSGRCCADGAATGGGAFGEVGSMTKTTLKLSCRHRSTVRKRNPVAIGNVPSVGRENFLPQKGKGLDSRADLAHEAFQ